MVCFLISTLGVVCAAATYIYVLQPSNLQQYRSYPDPTATVAPTVPPTPSPTPIPTPSPTPSPTATPTPTPTPTEAPTPTPSPTASPTPSPTVTPSPSPTPSPTEIRIQVPVPVVLTMNATSGYHSDTVELTATVAHTYGLETINFYDNGVYIGTSPFVGTQAKFLITKLSDGNHVFMAGP